jgi:hypothetical protein
MNLKIVARNLAAFLEHSPSSQSAGRAAAAAQCHAVAGENSLPVT